MASACNRHGKDKSEVNVWSENLDGKRSLGRTWCGWDNNTKMD
jgi:hypothetical protein